MSYFGWTKVETVLRYTRAFELKQIYKIMNGNGNGVQRDIRICPRCQALVPEGAKFCPNCGLKLVDLDVEELIRKKKNKEKLLKLVLRLVEEVGAEGLKELLVSHGGVL